jgi:uncharacterized membrane protein YeaQ/YmgE (transglycosylase-associated protein family)
MEILILVIIGAVAGWLASFIIPNGFGLIGTIVVGILGGLLGGYLLGNALSITSNAMVNSIILAFAGAVVLLFIIRLIKKA